jgi:hypothetical protein
MRRAGERDDADEYVSWREADLRRERSRTSRRVLRLLTWATAVTAFVVLLMDVQRDPVRCHPNCFDGSDNTFEAGHVWTGYFGSWQWEAQFLIGWAGFLAAVWAAYTAGRRSRAATIASLGLSVGCVLVWIVWVTVQPGPRQFV